MAPVIFVNVLDPKKHKKENVEATYPVESMEAVIPITGILPGTVQVKTEADDTALEVETDYVLSFNDDGNLVITLVAGGRGAEATGLKVSSTSIDPTVVDADGLFALARSPQARAALHGKVVLTPHFGEMARLCRMEIAAVRENQEALARRYAAEWGCIVLLKGARSVIAAPDGRYAWNETGNPGLAKGGSGDVLAGIALAMLGQKLEPFEAACAASFLLGASADVALDVLRERMLMARDVTEMVEWTLQNSVYQISKRTTGGEQQC